jgi:hypothetical protein
VEACFACDITQLFSVVFCVVRLCVIMTKELLKPKQRTKDDQLKDGNLMTETSVFDRIFFFYQQSSRVLSDSSHAAQVNYILLSKRQ